MRQTSLQGQGSINFPSLMLIILITFISKKFPYLGITFISKNFHCNSSDLEL